MTYQEMCGRSEGVRMGVKQNHFPRYFTLFNGLKLPTCDLQGCFIEREPKIEKYFVISLETTIDCHIFY
jgi:hypothetical protein